VALNDGGNETVTFTNLILATGATTFTIPGSQISKNVVTYEEQIMDANLPKSMIIAGGGAIGCEFAYIYHNYGVDVTIVEFLDHLLPREDEEVSVELEKQYKKIGIKFMTKTKVEKIEDTGSGAKVTVTVNGAQQTMEADKVLQAISFKPRTEGYGLDKTGVKLTERGAVEINAKMQTSVPHIYAIGDVTAKLCWRTLPKRWASSPPRTSPERRPSSWNTT
jgi:dihydrolipoamide dehydrogenase